jgi:subtilisin family serine protease
MNLFYAKRRAARAARPRTRPALEPLEGRALLSGDAPLLIQLNAPAALGTVGAMAAGARVSLAPSAIPDLVVASGAASDLGTLQAVLRSRGLTDYIEPQATLTIDAAPNDPEYAANKLWGLSGAKGIQAATAWNYSTGSTQVVVADIDTGVDYAHPDLYKNIWINQKEIPAGRLRNLADLDGDGLITFWDLNDPRDQGPGKITDLDGDGRITAADILKPAGKTNGVDNGSGGWSDGTDADGNGYADDLVGWNFVKNSNNPMDDNGHGTHTAGTLGAMGNNGAGVVGVNWKAQIMPLKFLDASGSGSDLGAAAALNYSVNMGARVSNNSYGGGGGGRTLGNAIENAGNRGALFVAASGNTGTNNDATANYPSSYPYDNIIAVAAIDSGGNRPNFSNYGATTVDLAAPGYNIESTTRGGGYGYMTGTSMASPHVAGAAALVLAAHPGWTAAQVKGALMATATPVASYAGKSVTGGILNLGQALAANADAPRVAQVYASGSSWAAAFKAGLGSASYGYPIPAGADQNLPLPWVNVDRVAIQFTKAVDPATLAGALSMTATTPSGTAPFAGGVAFLSYDAATKTAVYKLGASLANARYNLVLSPGVADAGGTPLDGSWSNGTHAYPSGNGKPGTGFAFSFRALPGDVNRTGGTVNSLDLALTYDAQFKTISGLGYSYFNDVNGNGSINSLDLAYLYDTQFTSVVS